MEIVSEDVRWLYDIARANKDETARKLSMLSK